jgi:hypothetical protein
MNREEKILMAIDKGYTCNPETGEVFGVRGGVVKSKKPDGYIVIPIYKDKKRCHLKAHQFIYYWVNKKVVDYIDHINMVRDDNRIDNLRSVTNQQNGFNTNAKGYNYIESRNKWMSRIKFGGKNKFLGYFNTEEEARQAYQEAKKIYHII